MPELAATTLVKRAVRLRTQWNPSLPSGSRRYSPLVVAATTRSGFPGSTANA